jgi:hypothetical protein
VSSKALVCTNELIDEIGFGGQFRLLRILEIVLPCLSEDLLTIKKNYTIVASSDYAYGKWPDTLGNSFFTDSNWLI